MNATTERALWNSARGYSKPGEIVTVLARSRGYVHIKSEPDAGEDGPSFYWVPEHEVETFQGG